MYILNEKKIISEEFEGDLVLVHLDSGSYYNLTGTGGELFKLITNNYSEDEIRNLYGESFDHEAFSSFVSSMLSEEIIVAGTSNTEKKPIQISNFSNPVLEKYDDMQDIIKLDPIHDVDETTGWPKTPDNNEK